jgi:hypothetical protein
MTCATYKGRRHDKEQNNMTEAYFLPMGDAARAAQNVRRQQLFQLKK